MGYIITSRTYVATLEEARDVILRTYARTDLWPGFNAVSDLTEAGGTVGPLPDGTVIEVRNQ